MYYVLFQKEWKSTGSRSYNRTHSFLHYTCVYPIRQDILSRFAESKISLSLSFLSLSLSLSFIFFYSFFVCFFLTYNTLIWNARHSSKSLGGFDSKYLYFEKIKKGRKKMLRPRIIRAVHLSRRSSLNFSNTILFFVFLVSLFFLFACFLGIFDFKFITCKNNSFIRTTILFLNCIQVFWIKNFWIFNSSLNECIAIT